MNQNQNPSFCLKNPNLNECSSKTRNIERRFQGHHLAVTNMEFQNIYSSNYEWETPSMNINMIKLLP